MSWFDMVIRHQTLKLTLPLSVIQVFIDRFRYNANRAAQVQSKLKLLEKL